jgi:broad specificity phosphatase PhoE
MSIVWLRHGETALNTARVVQPADTPLSERGLRQAGAVARRLAALAPVALLSSDLPRARQTAQALAEVTGLPVHTDPVLRERNFGALRGRTHDSLGFELHAMVDAPPDGESMAAFLARVALAWQRVAAQRAGMAGPLVVVSHGLLIHAALRHHADWHEGPPLPPWLDNTAVSVVDADPPHRVRQVNCTAHLDGSPDGPAAPGAAA